MAGEKLWKGGVDTGEAMRLGLGTVVPARPPPWRVPLLVLLGFGLAAAPFASRAVREAERRVAIAAKDSRADDLPPSPPPRRDVLAVAYSPEPSTSTSSARPSSPAAGRGPSSGLDVVVVPKTAEEQLLSQVKSRALLKCDDYVRAS